MLNVFTMEIEDSPSPIREFNVNALPVFPEEQRLELPEPPYDIEVGCGVGFHPIRYHLENPERTLVAIERTKERFDKFLRRVENHPTNEHLIAIRADALMWIVHHIPPGSVARYFFLYPNPFPHKQRWHLMPFIQFVIDTMQVGGTLEIATNVAEYAQEAKETFLSQWHLECMEDRPVRPNESPRSHFEKKYLERGDECRNLVFRKPEPFDLESEPALVQ